MADEEKEISAFDKLNTRRQMFVMKYIEYRVGSAAYKEAYGTDIKAISDSTARSESARLLANPNVKTAIQEKLSKIWDKKERKIGKIFDELIALATADIRDVMDFSPDGTFTVKDLSECDTRAIKKIKIRREPLGKGPDKEDMGEAVITEIELYDKRGALSDLAEIVDMKKGVTVNPQTIIYLDRQDDKL